MKNERVKVAFLLLLCLPITALANSNDDYNDNYNNEEYNQYETTHYTPQYSPNDGQDYKTSDVRFFVGLSTALVGYDQVKISYNKANVSEKQTSTKVNYDIFDKSGLTFGVDSDNGFRLSLSVQHYNTDIKFADGSDDEASLLSFGAALNVPFVKKDITSPFLSLGISYISIDQGDININFPAYYVGLGITHNFTQDIFGTLSATYGFMSKTDISDLNISYEENVFVMGMGIGYRF